MNLNQLFENISADQRRVGQLPANFKAPNTSPQLSGPYPGRNATRGYLVGEAAGQDNTIYQVSRAMLDNNPGRSYLRASDDDILRDAARELSRMGMSDVKVRSIMRDPDFAGELIDTLRGPLMREAMKPSDIPPTMRDRLTMRDIERERPAGAYRFRVTFPDGATADFMDFEAAQQRAAADRGRISRLREEKDKGNPRIERILRMLRARHPQAENDLEALIYDFRSQQSQDRSDIARLDAENDAEEADIERLERMLDVIKKRRGAEAVPEPVQEDDIDDAMRDFLARGGKIQQEPARMPRLGTRLRQHGSRHIGQGREARAGQLSGRGANINPGGNKPVVAAEGLRDGEYHVATVTLDDGTVKKVRITSDEGFRDQITNHFRRQGRTVKDIKVDYAVRSRFDENKPRFTGAPARPAPAPIGPTPTLAPAPGRPTMTGRPGSNQEQRSIEQDLARRMAAEDVLGDVKRRLGDVLRQRQQKRAERMPARQAPQDVLGDPVKQIDLGDGNTLMIHGNEDDGFRIHLGKRVMPTRFATLEQAEMATAMFEAKRDACYNKVRSRYKVWPSAYASGALVQCRKKGAANWGKDSKD